MARINVFGIGMVSKSPYITAKLLTNFYAETRPAGEKSQMVGFKMCGRTLFHDFGSTPTRGGMEFEPGNIAIVVHRSVVYTVNNASVATAVGNLFTQDGRVSITHNGVQVMITDGLAGYIYSTVPLTASPQTLSTITNSGSIATATTAAPHGLTTGNIAVISGATPAAYNGSFTVTVTGLSTFTYNMASDPGGNATVVGAYLLVTFIRITAPGFPANPITCGFLGGRFLANFAASGRWYVSNPYDGLFWDALAFANAETNPDNIIALWTSNGQALLFGPVSLEPWGDSGGADFPFSLVQGQAAEWGLAATWSIAKYDNSLACLWKNRQGQVMVGTLNGYLPAKISNPDLDKIINGYANTADASGLSFMLGGHPMYQLNFPSAGESWQYDGSTQIWSKRKSYGITRDIGEYAFPFLNSTIIADYGTGRLYRLDPDALTDNGNPIELQITSETVADPELSRFTVTRFRLDVEVGVGTTNGQGEDPQIGLECSRDNGKTWGAQQWRTLGKKGEYSRTVDWDNFGTARNFVFRLTVTDPVNVTLVSACVNPKD